MKLDPKGFYSTYTPSAVLRVTGDDALAFLQGQFTQELRFPAGSLCAYGLWLNQKGKVLADSFALREGETWWLVSVSSPAATLRERLESYIIADDVVLEDETPRWRGLALFGDSTQVLQAAGVPVPPAGEWSRAGAGFLFRGRRGAAESWEWILPANAEHPDFLRSAAIPEADLATAERARIRAGIPRIPDEVGPGDLPNEAGLEEVAVSYSKGCYLGQEVMARLKSMGQVRRRLMPILGDGPIPTLPATLYWDAKKVGELRSAVPDENGDRYLGLAMLSLLGFDREKPLSVVASGNPCVKVLEVAP